MCIRDSHYISGAAIDRDNFYIVVCNCDHSDCFVECLVYLKQVVNEFILPPSQGEDSEFPEHGLHAHVSVSSH